jgi:hypothetical protein
MQVTLPKPEARSPKEGAQIDVPSCDARRERPRGFEEFLRRCTRHAGHGPAMANKSRYVYLGPTGGYFAITIPVNGEPATGHP